MFQLAAITFLASPWLFGLVAVALPIIAHLAKGKRAQTLMIPTVRFIQAARMQVSSRNRPVDLLLLLLRCLIVLCAVLAFARPVYLPGQPMSLVAPSVGANALTEVVLILDGSASMRRVDHGTTLFNRAKREARALLESFAARNIPVALISTTERGPVSVYPRLSSNSQGLLDALDQIEPTFARMQPFQAVAMASSLRSAESTNSPSRATRSVVVITDGQQSEWDNLDGSLENTTLNSIQFVLVQDDSSHIENWSVGHISVSPRQPLVGDELTIEIEVALHSTAESLNVEHRSTLALRFGEQTLRQVIQLDGSDSKASFSFSLPAVVPAGVLEIRAWVEVDGSTDAFEWDNERAIAVRIRDQIKVGLVTTSHHSQISETSGAAYFIERALAPSASSSTTVSRYDAQTVGALEARPSTSRIWHENDVLVVSDAGDLSKRTLRALDQFLRRGGGVVWILDSVDAVQSMQRFNQLQSLAQNSPANASSSPTNAILFAPHTWHARQVNDDSRSLTAAGNSALEHQNATAYFGNLGQSGLAALKQAKFHSFVEGQVGESGRSLLTLGTDNTTLESPAFITGSKGDGRLIVFAASIRPADSDLVRLPIFVPFLHEVIRSLLPSSDVPLQSVIGDRVALPIPTELASPAAIKVLPAGIAHSIQLGTVMDSQQFGIRPDSSTVLIGPLAQPGLVQVVDSQSDVVLQAIGCAVASAESDVGLIQSGELAALQELAQDRVSIGDISRRNFDQDTDDDRNGLFSAIGVPQTPTELWPAVILIAVLCFLIENIFLATIGWKRRVQTASMKLPKEAA